MNRLLTVTVLNLILFSAPLFAQEKSLQTAIEQIATSAKGKTGVSIFYSGDKSKWNVNAHDHFPMQSVYKFSLALAVLHKMEKEKWTLDKKIAIAKEDLKPGTLSPLREKYPEGNVEITLQELLFATVAQSDNNGCDILFRLIGGTKTADDFIHSLGIHDIAIKATEEDMHKAWEVQFTNWCTPLAMTGLLEKFFQKNLLSAAYKEFLWNTLTATVNGAKRIKGLLPRGTIVAHKPGTSGTNEQGIMAAVNDVGIVMLPDGEYFIISVFITNSSASLTDNEEVIAKVTKAVWDYYTNDR